MESWKTVPGLTEKGVVDEAVLRVWVTEVRRRCEENGNLRFADDRVGHVLAHAPRDADGAWPAMAIRNLIEDVASEELEEGMVVGILNKRGTVTKQIGEGGMQERELAAQFRAWSEAVAIRSPRSMSVLAKVAEHYEEKAAREDIRSKLAEE